MSIYPNGQCTDVDILAPWVDRYGNLDNARYWAANWQAHGGYVTETPTVGAVVCFQPGTYGAGPNGHVAYVTTVNGAMFTVKEMNFPEGSGWREGRVCAAGPGVSFLLENAPEDDMTEAQAMEAARGIVFNAYRAVWGKDPDSSGSADFWASKGAAAILAGNGLYAMLHDLYAELEQSKPAS